MPLRQEGFHETAVRRLQIITAVPLRYVGIEGNHFRHQVTVTETVLRSWETIGIDWPPR